MARLGFGAERPFDINDELQVLEAQRCDDGWGEMSCVVDTLSDGTHITAEDLALMMYEHRRQIAAAHVPPVATPSGDEQSKQVSTTASPTRIESGKAKRHPNQPGRDRQDDILAAIELEGTPLQRNEIVEVLRLKSVGKLGHQLAWMVTAGLLVNVPGRGYWPSDCPIPE